MQALFFPINSLEIMITECITTYRTTGYVTIRDGRVVGHKTINSEIVDEDVQVTDIDSAIRLVVQKMDPSILVRLATETSKQRPFVNHLLGEYFEGDVDPAQRVDWVAPTRTRKAMQSESAFYDARPFTGGSIADLAGWVLMYLIKPTLVVRLDRPVQSAIAPDLNGSGLYFLRERLLKKEREAAEPTIS